MIAGLAMALSSVCLVLNANRMRRVTLSPDTVSFTAAGGRDADRKAPDQHGARSIILDTETVPVPMAITPMRAITISRTRSNPCT